MREVTIYVTDLEGREHALKGVEGWRAMEVIRDYGLPIKAECGGACACATCHVYVDPAWIAAIPSLTEDERDMLDSALDVRENSRLSCQIILDPSMDGLKLRLAVDYD